MFHHYYIQVNILLQHLLLKPYHKQDVQLSLIFYLFLGLLKVNDKNHQILIQVQHLIYMLHISYNLKFLLLNQQVNVLSISDNLHLLNDLNLLDKFLVFYLHYQTYYYLNLNRNLIIMIQHNYNLAVQEQHYYYQQIINYPQILWVLYQQRISHQYYLLQFYP